MTARAILYARFSTENQSDASIERQLELCRDLARRLGACVVRELADAAISGQSMAGRPGLMQLMAAVSAGEADLVIAEHSDRLARDPAHGWAIHRQLRSLGVRYVTVQEGEVTTMHQGVSSLVSALKIEEAQQRTRGGLRDVVRAGRSGGGLTYGYRVKRAYDAAGEPIRGLLEVDPGQAEVVRRIFRDYAAGVSPQALAHALNIEGIPGPRGGTWNASTIGGNADRAVGIIHNALYVGERVWGRRTFVKDTATGRRRGRKSDGPPIRIPAPELAIVPAALWAAARARHTEVSTGPMGERMRRPQLFLSGLIVCGGCGRRMIRAGPRGSMRCPTRIEKGLCDNTRAPGYAGIEARVMAALRGNLLHPDVVAHAARTLTEARRTAQRDAHRRRAKAAGAIAEVERRMAHLIDQVEQGAPWIAVAGRHEALAAQLAALQAVDRPGDPAPTPDVTVRRHPADPAAAYRVAVRSLAATLAAPDAPEARSAIRRLVHEIKFIPAPARGEYDLEITGDLAPVFDAQNKESPLPGAFMFDNVKSIVGAGTGFEPVTFRL